MEDTTVDLNARALTPFTAALSDSSVAEGAMTHGMIG